MLSPDVLEAPSPRPTRRHPHWVAGISGLGAAVPESAVETDQIAAALEIDPSWIIKRTGIRSRRRLAAGERMDELAITASRAALADAGLRGEDLDAIIVGTSSADEIMPHAAPLVAAALGAKRAMAWDCGLACTGFLAGLEQAGALVDSGRAHSVLVVGVDALSRMTDHGDRKTAALFGDGAGAAVVTAGGLMALCESVLRTDATDADALVIGAEERLIRMDGPVVFRRAVAAMESSCREVLERAGLEPDEIDLVVPHQANARITQALTERLELDPTKVVDTIATHGNTGAASIPLALAAARAEGRLPTRGRILMTAFGAGFAYGALIVDVQEVRDVTA